VAGFCGSRLAVDYDLYKVKIAEVSSYVEAIIHDPATSIAKRHNLFTAYTVLNLMSSSGHRPVSDPFCFLADFDLEDNFVIINDKVLSPAYKNRISWLSDIASSQTQEYIKYLETLSERIKNTDSSESIKKLLDLNFSRSKQNIPFLFFLKEDLSGITNIKKASLKAVLKDLWPYKWNIFRHVLESKLYEKGITIDAINAHLGHHNNHQHPFGSKTSWTARECGDHLRIALNELSLEQGWKVVPCPTLTYIDSEKIKLYKSAPFGHIKRKKNLKSHKEKINNKIKDALQRHLVDENKLNDLLTNKQAQEAIQNEIISQFSESKRLLNYILKAFDNAIKEASFNHNIPLIRVNKPFKDEVSPFYGGWIDLYRSSKCARDNFVAYLKNRDHNSSTPEMLWAEICISALLFDGILQEDWIKDLIRTGPAGLLKIKKWNVFYDIYSDHSKEDDTAFPDWRWQPGALSKGLIYGMLERLGKTSSITLKSNKTKRYIEKYCQIILPEQYTGKSHTYLHQVIALSQAFWRYHIPNVFHQILIGKRFTSPLPQSVYARLIRKRRVETLSRTNIETPKIDSYTPHNVNSVQDQDINQFKRTISDIFEEAESVTGNKKQKVFIINKVEQYLDTSTTYSKMAFYLAKWVIHLCNRKVKSRKYLELSSIKTHYHRISSALISLVRTDDIVEYSIEDIEELYHKVITFKYNTERDLEEHANNCKLRAIQISQFDTFLQNHFCLETEDADWHYIAGQWAQYLDKKVDANLITPTEYLHTIAQIRTHNDFTDYQRIWVGAFIVIGFRFGLRISEVRRLTLEDIQMSDKHMIIHVLSSKLGRTKSLSGIRQIPLIGELNDSERYFIEQLILRTKDDLFNSLRTPLFTDATNNDQLIDTSLVWQTIHPILRHITGCPTVRFHSLRHGFANGIFSILFKKYGYHLVDAELDALWKDINSKSIQKLLNNSANHIESHHLTALTTIIGHADSSTTLNSYIHILDDIISGYTDNAFKIKPSIKELSTIINIDAPLLERRRRNCKAAVNDGNTTLKSIQLDEKVPGYVIRRTNWPLTLPESESKNLITLETIDLLFEWYGQRGRNHHRLNVIFDVDQKDIIKLIDIGMKIEKESSFYYYGLGGQLLNSWIEPDIIPETNKKNFERENFNKLLKKSETILTSPTDAKTLLDTSTIWRTSNTTFEDRHAYLFDGPDSLSTFITGLYLLGFTNKALTISIPSDLTDIQKEKANNKLKAFNIDISTHNGKIRKQNRQKGDLRKDRVRLSLIRSKKNLIQHNQTLSRLLFLLLVFDEFTMKSQN